MLEVAPSSRVADAERVADTLFGRLHPLLDIAWVTSWVPSDPA